MVNDTNKSSRDLKQQWSTLQSKALMTSNSNGQRYNQNISRYCLTSPSIYNYGRQHNQPQQYSHDMGDRGSDFGYYA